MLMLDTSAAVPLVMRNHDAHLVVDAAVGSDEPRLGSHAALETYSVLTRLPGDARLAPADASTLIASRFGDPIVPSISLSTRLVERLGQLRVAGGAVYDALIALTAEEAHLELLTRDRRASATYRKLHVQHRVI